MLGTIFSFLCVIVSILLVLVVIIQNSKGGGVNSAFGVGNISSMIGNRKVSEGVEKITWWMGGLLMACAFFATVFLSSPTAGNDAAKDALKEAGNKPAATAPAPGAPAPKP
jgi:preprotein translocase subunit SecG